MRIVFFFCQARALVSLMRDLGVRADVVTYTTIMDIYAKAAAQGQPGDWVTLSLQVLEDMLSSSFDTHISSSSCNFACRCRCWRTCGLLLWRPTALLALCWWIRVLTGTEFQTKSSV